MNKIYEKIVKASVAPKNTNVIWCDISVNPPILKTYSNGEWVALGSTNTSDPIVRGYFHEGVFYKDVEHTEILPSDTNSMYVDIPTNHLYTYDSEHYVSVSSNGIQKITYAELKALRDNGELVAGAQYRITDYHTTTVQENTQSADHQFDIIVVADDAATLNENARAIQHDFPLLPPQLFASINEELIDVYRAPGRDIDYEDTHYYAYSLMYPEGTPGGEEIVFCKNNPPVEHDAIYIIQNIDQMLEVDPEVFYFHYVEATDYFADSNLAAWELKYSLDNDTDRFAWAIDVDVDMVFSNESTYYRRYKAADTDIQYAWKECMSSVDDYTYYEDGEVIMTDVEVPEPGDTTYHIYAQEPYEAQVQEILRFPIKGSGIIYYMKDEWNNECPYDFKNIQFKRKLTDGAYDPESGTDTWVYTFTWVNESDSVEDLSIVGNTLQNDEGQYSGIYNNVIHPVSVYNMMSPESPLKFGIALNDIVFISSYNFEEGVFFGCCSNFFGTDCYSNTFGHSCGFNIFGNHCSFNTFGYNCNGNLFGHNCESNTFGNFCQTNKFSNFCSENTFGNECWANIFGINSCYNTFGNGCESNIFDNDCQSNTFGDTCLGNIFGIQCSSNTFGDVCQVNIFNPSCNHNIFGEECSGNIFGTGCYSNTFGEECSGNIFGNGCYFNTFGDHCSQKHLETTNQTETLSGTTPEFWFNGEKKW